MKLKLILPLVDLVLLLIFLGFEKCQANVPNNNISDNISIVITPPGKSGVALLGEDGTTKVSVSKGESAITSGKLEVNCEFDNGDKKKFEFPVSFSASSAVDETFAIPTDHIGYWQITADFTSSGESASTFSGVAIVQKAANYDSEEKQSFFGAMLVRDFEAADRMGCKIDREMAIWAYIESEKGVYNWAGLDKVIDAAEKHNVGVVLDVVPNLVKGKRIAWATWEKDYDLINEPNFGYYKAFLTALVDRYKGKLVAIELMNEPDLEFFKKANETEDRAVEFVQKVQRESCKIIRSIDPDVPIIGLSVSGADFKGGMNFFKSALPSPDAASAIDAFGGHGYSPGRFIDEDHAPVYPDQYDLVGETNSSLDIMRRDGLKPRFWGTEIGYSYKVGTLPLSEVGKSVAAALAQTFITIKSIPGAEKLFWYVFTANNDNGPDGKYNYSLIYTKNGSPFPYPSVSAFAASARVLDETKPAGLIKINNNLVAHRFTSEDGKKVIVALWSNSRNYKLKLQSANAIHIFDIFGREEESGSTIAITRDPTYFVFSDSEQAAFEKELDVLR